MLSVGSFFSYEDSLFTLYKITHLVFKGFSTCLKSIGNFFVPPLTDERRPDAVDAVFTCMIKAVYGL